MRHHRLLILLFFTFTISIKAQVVERKLLTKRINYLTDNKKQTPLDSAIDNSVVSFMQSPQNCGLSIGVIKDSITYYYNYGETKRDNKTLPTNATLFEIGSITKTFCGILLAIAVNEGKINLEDDIRKYLPGKYPNLETNRSAIKIKHLANHTSGLPRIPDNLNSQSDYNYLDPYKNYTKEMVFEFLKTVKLSREPGQICEYSNLGMGLLGIILEKIYNKTFDEIVKEKICIPNGMNSTAVNLSKEQTYLFADGYTTYGDSVPHWDLGALTAAGGIRSTTKDMLNYLNYNLEEKDENTKLAHRSTFNNGSNVALAWHIITTKKGYELIWHNGGTFGFSSFCGFMKEKNCAIIVLSNSGTNVDNIGLSILKFLQK